MRCSSEPVIKFRLAANTQTQKTEKKATMEAHVYAQTHQDAEKKR